MSASNLDAALPDRPFAGWFSEVIGPKAGVVWQLTECGEQIGAPDKTGRDLRACAEINANLPDGRKVFVAMCRDFQKGADRKAHILPRSHRTERAVLSGPPVERIAADVARSGRPFYDRR
jgi:hypothetical protein